MPQPSSKMNTWFSAAFTTATSAVVITVTRGREMPLKNPSTAHSATPIGAPSMRGCQNSSACRCTSASRPNGAQESAAAPRQRREYRRGQQGAPERDPGGVARAPAPPAAFRLRDEGLHREPDPAEQHHEEQHQPVDRRHGGHRRRRDVADEPGVRQADDGLQAAVQHQRQRERRDRAIVDARAASRPVALAMRLPPGRDAPGRPALASAAAHVAMHEEVVEDPEEQHQAAAPQRDAVQAALASAAGPGRR